MKNPVLDWLCRSSRSRSVLLLLVLSFLLAIFTVQSAQAQTYRVLFQFRSGVGGANPNAGLVLDSSGNLCGTTASDGAFDSGVVFELNSDGKETVLHSFTATGGDGEYPLAGLVRDAAGNLYGVTLNGGTYNVGAVFKIDKNGKEACFTVSTATAKGPNSPWGGLIRDAAGNLHGTTGNGGTFYGGVVSRLDTSGALTVLHNFDTQSGDGYFPAGNLLRDAAGNLYGTTEFGGTSGSGIVFKEDASGNETVLHNFAGGTADGGLPFLSGLLRDAKGNLYGVTDEGGAFSFGTVYRLNPAGKETILHSFNGKDGKIPYGTLIMDQAGNLYGTTNGGGAHNAGVVFEITP